MTLPARIRQLQNMNGTAPGRKSRSISRRVWITLPLAAGAFPLTRRHAVAVRAPGACAGGRCRAYHPSAGGAGVNLGYRDVDALIDVLVNARSYGKAWASYPVLKRYPDAAHGWITSLCKAVWICFMPDSAIICHHCVLCVISELMAAEPCWRVETSGAEICVRVVALQHCRMRANAPGRIRRQRRIRR